MAYTTIDDPSAHFQIALWTGNGSSGTAVTNDGNSNLQPDWLWGKIRDDNADQLRNNWWIDSTRGINKALGSNTTSVEETNSGYLNSFDSDGFTLGNDGNSNDSGDLVVGWQWKANGGSRTTFTESSNNPGGGYQANTTAGFSIVDYTGTGGAGTVSHGLGAVPKLLIVKNRDAVTDWAVYHRSASSAGNDSYLEINTQDAVATAGTVWNDTSPSSSVFTVGTNTKTNTDGEKYIAYCLTPIQGYSKFGSYTGNGNADGPFIYTGFKPAWTMIKNTQTNTNSDWTIYDNKRSATGGGNENNKFLRANGNQEEASASGIDILSNGFKMRSTSSRHNANDSTYIYWAFAQHPFVSSKGVPTTAK